MYNMRIRINSEQGKTLALSEHRHERVSLVYPNEYQKGDKICLETNEKGHYFIKFDEAIPETLIYVDKFETGGLALFNVPYAEEKKCYSPKAFYGGIHVLTARKATKDEINIYRNLALNPYDRHTNVGFYPHVSANIETRNEVVFAGRNAIDGVFENLSHGNYPYCSWGVNRDPNAALTLDFGRNVQIDKIRITLRADFPHDNYWTEGEIKFSDGSVEKLFFEKTTISQEFTIKNRIIKSLEFTNLIKSNEISPFPALRQIEVFGTDVL